MRRTLVDPEGNAVVLALRARFDGRQLTDAVLSVRAESRAPRGAQERIVAVDESGDVIRLGVVVLHEKCVILDELLLPRNAGVGRTRVLEVLVEDEDIGMIGRCDARLRDQVRVRRKTRRAVGARRIEAAVPEDRLPAAAVGGSRRSEVQSRHTAVEQSGVRAQNRLSVRSRVPRDSKARLEHLVIRWNLAVRRELLTVLRLTDELGEEDLVGWSDRIGLDLRFPSQSVLHVERRAGLPGVLDEHGRLGLRDLLRTGLLDC